MSPRDRKQSGLGKPLVRSSRASSLLRFTTGSFRRFSSTRIGRPFRIKAEWRRCAHVSAIWQSKIDLPEPGAPFTTIFEFLASAAYVSIVSDASGVSVIFKGTKIALKSSGRSGRNGILSLEWRSITRSRYLVSASR